LKKAIVKMGTSSLAS